MRALLDTSFFVATESGRPLGDMAGVTETEVSVVTLAELTLGVLMADDAERAARVATLSAVESTWDPLPVDAEVARQFAAPENLGIPKHSFSFRSPAVESPLSPPRGQDSYERQLRCLPPP